jgi:hypothetical protein
MTTNTPEPNDAHRMEAIWNLTERLNARSYGDHALQFANRDVQTLTPAQLNTASPIELSPHIAYALRCAWDDTDTVADRLVQLLNSPNTDQIEALVIGLWADSEGICVGDDSTTDLVTALINASDRLPNLKALFIGDITSEECEISWLVQSDISPVLQAYPQLEMLQVRGGTGLRFEAKASHANLKALILETGGLSRETVYQLYDWQFPALEHLEFWFGSENYGGDCWEHDMAAILEDLKFPNLTYLGLRNAQFTHELMERLVRSPLLPRLQVLDLSMGTLGDDAAMTLLECLAVRDLTTLNVSESYLSGGMIEQLQTLGIQVIAVAQRDEEEEEDPADRRYCAVSE